MSTTRRPGSAAGEVDVRGSSTRAAIPADRNGYAIDVRGRLLHRRYADHAAGLPRVRGEAGVRTYLGDEWSACEECWPVAVTAPAKRSRAGSSLRARRAELIEQRAELIDAGVPPEDLLEPVELERSVEPEREDPDQPGDHPEEVEE